MKTKIYSMLGLATKAGKVVSGEFSTEKAIKDLKASLVIIAENASDNTKKHFSDMCSYRDIPVYVWGNSEETGHAIGKEFRVTVAITDAGFAKTLKSYLEQEIN